ncbi:SH3 domain-containing protein [Pararhodobacter aggregans]|uniref:SH3b domain-containing protein n=1 Tax=Pararhodobacter aggregans TaxID=404875 RepID=A0A2T7UR54_9RHOB|nr:SH3 domain-containing protein [Pararhodobacter aggregans]PTX01957.1 SH3 domain-containing protein [Pararhodobacter aggregans]PVE47142.1 hypothetical protein DDE23_12910 [Pararhodobacter aggregans]
MLRNALIAATLALIPAAASAADSWTTAGVNFRSGPSAYYPVIATLPHCAAITTYEWQDGWVRAEWQGGYGWLSGRYVSDSNAHCSYGGGYGHQPAPAPSYPRY